MGVLTLFMSYICAPCVRLVLSEAREHGTLLEEESQVVVMSYHVSLKTLQEQRAPLTTRLPLQPQYCCLNHSVLWYWGSQNTLRHNNFSFLLLT